MVFPVHLPAEGLEWGIESWTFGRHMQRVRSTNGLSPLVCVCGGGEGLLCPGIPYLIPTPDSENNAGRLQAPVPLLGMWCSQKA